MSRQLSTIWRRRALLAGGVLAVAAWTKGAPHLLSLRAPALAFRELPYLPGFQELVGAGIISVANPLFAGLSEATVIPPEIETLRQTVRDAPCLALYGPSASTDAVTVAFFSDFNCPNCRIMEARLAKIQAQAPGTLRIIRHELPILGAASITASRAVLAADLQGAYDEMGSRLIRTPAVTDEDYIAQIATGLGLDVKKLLNDMQSAAITARLQRSKAIADVFHFVGTPAFVIGRTVFMGTVPTAQLEALIAGGFGAACTDAYHVTT